MFTIFKSLLFLFLFLLHPSLSLNPYQVLGLSRTSSNQLVNKALKRMAITYKNDSFILSLLKQSYGEIKMYQLLDRGIYQPKKSGKVKGKYNLKEISISDYIKLTGYIFCNLLPITLLVYCIRKRGERKNIGEKRVRREARKVEKRQLIEDQIKIKSLVLQLQEQNQNKENNIVKQLKEKESTQQRKIRLIKDECYFPKK